MAGPFSTSTTRAPSLAARAAAVNPAMPAAEDEEVDLHPAVCFRGRLLHQSSRSVVSPT